MKRSPLLLTAVLATLALVGLGACSSDDGSADKDSSTKTAAANDTESDGEGSDQSSNGEDGPGEDVGESGSASVDDSLVDQLITSMSADGNTAFTGFSEDQARCYAEANIRIIGADRVRDAIDRTESQPEGDDPFALDAYGYDDLGITEAEAGDIYDAGRSCGIDFRSLMLDAMSQDSAIENLPPAAMKCIEEAVTEDALRTFMVSIMSGGLDPATGPADFDLFEKLMACDTEFGGI